MTSYDMKYLLPLHFWCVVKSFRLHNMKINNVIWKRVHLHMVYFHQ